MKLWSEMDIQNSIKVIVWRIYDALFLWNHGKEHLLAKLSWIIVHSLYANDCFILVRNWKNAFNKHIVVYLKLARFKRCPQIRWVRSSRMCRNIAVYALNIDVNFYEWFWNMMFSKQRPDLAKPWFPPIKAEDFRSSFALAITPSNQERHRNPLKEEL